MPNDPTEPTQESLRQSADDLRSSAANKGKHGGRRPGAGAPKGNLNGLKHGLRSKQVSQLGLVFAANPKRVLSRDRLLELANARDAEAFDRAIDLRIMRIRRKIEPDPARPSVIRTVRGGGYLFSPTGEAPALD